MQKNGHTSLLLGGLLYLTRSNAAFCECGLSDTIYHASAKTKSGNLLSTSEKQMKNARVSVCRRAHSFLLSATKCLESLLRKEELAGLEDFKRSFPTSVILWLQAALLAATVEAG